MFVSACSGADGSADESAVAQGDAVSSVPEADYVLQSVNSGKCIDIKAAGTANGTDIQQYQCNGTGAQRFHLKSVGNGSYAIENPQSGKALDVRDVSVNDGACLQIWEYGGGANQQFQLDDKGNGEYVIRARHSGKVLDVDAWSKNDGAAILQWAEHGGANQRFRLLKQDGGTPPPSGWNLVWSDEFNNGSIDESKWSYEVKGPGWVNHELQGYTDHRSENARVENGHLVVEGRHDWFNGQEYTSARLKTQGKASWTYGRVEASIKLSGGWGTWPAFWMMPDNQSRGWPACGEIDIMEEVGYDQDSIHATTHSAAYNWKSSNQRTAATPVGGVTTGYHTYALEWYPDHIDMFVDGRNYFTSRNDITGDDAWPFNKNFHIILNLAIGGDWGGAQGVDPNIWPRQMLVDYVRVYQR